MWHPAEFMKQMGEPVADRYSPSLRGGGTASATQEDVLLFKA